MSSTIPFAASEKADGAAVRPTNDVSHAPGAFKKEGTTAMHLNYTLNRAVDLYGDKIGVIDGESRFTWKEFKERCLRFAGGLARLGLERGDRLAICALNSHKFLEAYYAASLGGYIIVPLNIRLSSEEVAYILKDAECETVLADETLLPLFDAPPLAGEFKLIALSGPKRDASYEEIMQATEASGEGFEEVEGREDDLYGLFYTSGTTGESKGVMLTHRNLFSNTMNVLCSLEYDDEEVYLHAGPMFHLADSASTFAITLLGGTHTFVPRFDPALVRRAIETVGVTATVLVPTMINAILQDPTLPEWDVSSLKKMLYGASPISPARLKQAMKAFEGCAFHQAYGQTEASPVLTVLDAESHRRGAQGDERLLASCGKPVVGVEVKILGGNDREVEIGEVGEVAARGPNVMLGYLNKPEETAAALRGGWLRTGDLAVRDAEGFFTIVDRKKDMIVTGGENVFCTEVEAALFSHPAVAECAVFGAPSEEWGEEVRAAVVLKPDVRTSAEQLSGHCREHLAGFKVPRGFDFHEELPKGGTGKILKRELRDAYWKGEGRKVH